MRITIFFLLIFTLRLGAQNDVEQSRQRLEEYLSASEYTEPEIVDIIDFSFYLFDTLKQKGLTDSSKLLVKSVLTFTEKEGLQDLGTLADVTFRILNEAANTEEAYLALKDYPVENIQSDALRAKACKMIGKYHLWYAEKDTEALKFFLQALEIYTNLKARQEIFLTYMDVKSVYYNRDDTEKQLFYLRKAEEYIAKTDTITLIEIKMAYANLYG